MKSKLFFASLGLTLLPLLLAASSAEAVTCAKGSNHAGCVGKNGAVAAGPNGATSVHKTTTPACKTVNGVKVCK